MARRTESKLGAARSREMVDQGIPIRLVLYSVAIAYLLLDFFVIAGPLRRAIFRKNPNSTEVIEAAKRQGVVARVFYQPILLSQVDRRVEEDLWKAGRTVEGLERSERLMLRRAALSELIDLHLLRVKVRFNQEKAVVTEAEVAAEVRTIRSRFASEKEFRETLAERGWSAEELEYRLAARLQQERYLEQQIVIAVSEEEAREWFEANAEELALPERVRARHIFRSTVGRDSAAARAELELVQRKLERGEATFEELAAAESEDPGSKEEGGELGWLQAGRVPAGFADPLFALAPGEAALLQSASGWHLVEVLEKLPRTLRSYEEARADVMAALEAVKRDEGVKRYREQLRERDKSKVDVFLDVLERGLEEAASP